MKLFTIPLLTLFIAFAVVPPAKAESADIIKDSADHVDVTLLSGYDLTGSQGKIPVGLQIDLDSGWHTYWRHSGDSGLPPRFNWSESQNVKDIKIYWPSPRRFDEFGFQTFGYMDSVTIPLDIQIERPGEPVIFDLKLDIMVCNEICIPQTIALKKTYPVGEAIQTRDYNRILVEKRKLPFYGGLNILDVENVIIGPEGLVLSIFSKAGLENIDVFVTAGDYAFTAVPEITPDDSENGRARLKLAPPADLENKLEKFLSANPLEIILVNGRHAVKKEIRF